MNSKSLISSRMFCFLTVILLALIATNAWAEGPKVSLLGSPFISTLAGQGWDGGGYSGDGSAASAATLYYPHGVITDNSGNVYIADSDNFAIRVVNTQNVAITVFGVTIQPGNIATVAGNGTEGLSGDGGPATSAQLGWILALALDGSGNLYMADVWEQLIRKVASDGTISTFAGVPHEGEGCYAGDNNTNGDGGPATSAVFDCVYGVATDTLGNVYVSDGWAGLVRQINTQGVINTVAGNKANTSYCEGSTSGDGGPALNAIFGCILGVRTDQNGNLYIADYYASVVHVVNMQASTITVAGVSIPAGYVDIIAGTNGTCDYSGDGGPATSASVCEPYDVSPDRLGNVYITDSENDVIRKVAVDGTITTFAGTYDDWDWTGDGGPAASATLYWPTSVTADTLGNVYIADTENNSIRKVSPNGGGTATDLGSVALGSDTTQMVQLYMNQAVTISTLSASGDYAITTAPERGRQRSGHRRARGSVSRPMGMPASLAKLRQKSLERRAGRTRNVRPAGNGGNDVSCIGTFTQGDVCTTWVKFTPTKPGPRWFQLTVTDSDQNKYKFGLTGTGVGSLVSITPGIINTPSGAEELGALVGMARDSAGNLYVSDYLNHVVLEITTQGVVSTFAGVAGTDGYDGDGGPATSAHLNDPFGLSFDSTGNLYIADTWNNVIRKVDVNGVITTVAGNSTAGYSGDGGLATDAELYNPMGVLADAAGNLYVADTFNNVVRLVTTSGKISTIAGNGYGAGTGGWYPGGTDGLGGWSGDGGPATEAEMYTPVGMALDSNGNLYIADVQNSAIRKVDASGNMSTVAGVCGDGCTSGYSGDGGPATSAEINYAFGVAVDPAGDFYIADTDNGVIRKVDVNGIITTVAGVGFSQGTLRRNGRAWQVFAKPGKARRSRAHSNQQTGDGGVATGALLAAPVSVLVDNSGSFYLSDVGFGSVRVVDVTTSDMNFGTLDVNVTSDPMAATVSNTGNAALNLSLTTLSTNFAWGEATTCGYPSTLAVGASCTVAANFTPPSGGNFTGTMALTDDAYTSPQGVTLEGAGAQPDYSISASPTSLTITQGQSGTATLTVTPMYGYAGTITFSCSGLPALSACVFAPTSAVFDGSSSTPVTVTLTVNTTGTAGMASLAEPVRPNSVPRTPLYAMFVPLALAGAVLLRSGDRDGHRSRSIAVSLLLGLALAGGIVFINACGHDSHPVSVTPVGTYTSTVTASASAGGGGAQHQATITITIVQ